MEQHLEAIARVTAMEALFDALRLTAEEDPAALADSSRLEELKRYYESGEWLRDYELDEQGLLPRDLKRGVLSQDGLFDFLEEIRAK